MRQVLQHIVGRPIAFFMGATATVTCTQRAKARISRFMAKAVQEVIDILVATVSLYGMILMDLVRAGSSALSFIFDQMKDIVNATDRQQAPASDGGAWMRLYTTANLEDTEQAAVIERFFSALYGSKGTPFDLAELRKLDQEQLDDCCVLLRMHAKRQVAQAD